MANTRTTRRSALTLAVVTAWTFVSGCEGASEAQAPETADLPGTQQTAGPPGGETRPLTTPEPVSAALAACLPPAGVTPWTLTGRTRQADGAEFALAEPAGTAQTTEFDPVVVRLFPDGTCEGARIEPQYGSLLADIEGGGPDGDAWVDLRHQSFQWHAEQVGGPEGFATLFRAQFGPDLTDCPLDGDTGACLPAWRAQQFRDAGVAVARSEPTGL